MPVRCPWAELSEEYRRYHDTEWGVPVHDDRVLFEFLVLEGAQAGLSWRTILSKRENYRAALSGFEPHAVAAFDSARIESLLQNPGIVRNRRKVEAAVSNARLFVDIQREFGSFDRYAWRFVGGKPLRHAFREMSEVPAFTPEAEDLSRDLKRRGFRFAGPTICYAFMQAVGMVNDHLTGCFRYHEV
jgi:DNA-3-methyladenine glycosylase I